MAAPLDDEMLGLLRSLSGCVPAAQLHTRLEIISIAEALSHAGLIEGPRAF
jgi:hypothetical protein